MAKQRANYVLLFPALLTFRLHVDVSPAPSASAIKPPSQQWAVTLQRQSSMAGSTLTKLTKDLLPATCFLFQHWRHVAWDPRLQRLFR
jgi:hypothetical protein